MDYQLKYPFVAVYNDGTYFQQPLNDKSKDKEGKSAFSDVDHDKLIKFFIAGENYAYGVDLRDGHFEVNGIPFFMHSDLDGMKDFKLIYFRDIRRHFNQSNNGEKPKQVAMDIIYQIGWKCIINGKEQERVMEVL